MGNKPWAQLQQAVLARFRTFEEGDAVKSITKLRQIGIVMNINDNLKDWLIESVIEYQRQFDRLAYRTQNLSESFFICCFLSGLQEDIKIGVQMLKLATASLLQTFEPSRF